MPISLVPLALFLAFSWILRPQTIQACTFDTPSAAFASSPVYDMPGATFLVSDLILNQEEGLAACEASGDGAHLATIRDLQEHQNVDNIFKGLDDSC